MVHKNAFTIINEGDYLRPIELSKKDIIDLLSNEAELEKVMEVSSERTMEEEVESVLMVSGFRESQERMDRSMAIVEAMFKDCQEHLKDFV